MAEVDSESCYRAMDFTPSLECWRDFKHTLDLRPVYHRRADRTTAYAQLCWLGLLLIRYAEARTGDTWRHLRNELNRLTLVTRATSQGHVAERTTLTAGQRGILAAHDLPKPPHFYDFTPIGD